LIAATPAATLSLPCRLILFAPACRFHDPRYCHFAVSILPPSAAGFRQFPLLFTADADVLRHFEPSMFAAAPCYR